VLCVSAAVGMAARRPAGRHERSLVKVRTVTNSVVTKLQWFITDMLIEKCEQHLTVFPSCVLFTCLFGRVISHLLRDLIYS